jgi:hypothetical protein
MDARTELLLMIFITAFIYLVLNILFLWQWKGLWRFLAMLPVAFWVLWMIHVAYDPKFHSMLPYELIQDLVIASFYLLVLWCIHLAVITISRSDRVD